MEGRGFIFTVFATFCFLSIIIESTVNGNYCDIHMCGCDNGLIFRPERFPDGPIKNCCIDVCNHPNNEKRGNNLPDERFIQDKVENDQAIVRFLLQNEKYKADFARYLEQSWPDDKSAFLQWLSQELKM